MGPSRREACGGGPTGPARLDFIRPSACPPAVAATRQHRCCRLEEASAKEEERQLTLLCVNRLWEELNASIGFIQFRCGPRVGGG